MGTNSPTGLEVAPGLLPKTLEEALAFAKETGYPLIMKPDIGVGAEGAKKINSDSELTKNWDPKVAITRVRYAVTDIYSGKPILRKIHPREYRDIRWIM